MESLQRKAAPATIYEAIRRIKDKPRRKINIIQENGQIYATVPEIASRLAQTFNNISSDNNYTHEFRTYKNAKEMEAIEFTSDNLEPYNRLFTIEDVEHNIAKVKDTTPGLDAVHYQMIKRMPEEGKLYLCEIFNKFFLKNLTFLCNGEM